MDCNLEQQDLLHVLLGRYEVGSMHSVVVATKIVVVMITVLLEGRGGEGQYKRVHTCTQGSIALAASRRASHNFGSNAAVLLISGIGAGLTGLGQAGHHPSAAGCIAAPPSQIEGGR